MTAEARQTKTVLLLAYGNPGRLDDGLGPALAEAIAADNWPDVTVDIDYQLVIEDAATVAAHDVVIFADAAIKGREPFYFKKAEARNDATFTTHSCSPEAIMHLAHTCFAVNRNEEAYILGIRGYEYNEFGEQLSEKAKENLQAALVFLRERFRKNDFSESILE